MFSASLASKRTSGVVKLVFLFSRSHIPFLVDLCVDVCAVSAGLGKSLRPERRSFSPDLLPTGYSYGQHLEGVAGTGRRSFSGSRPLAAKIEDQRGWPAL